MKERPLEDLIDDLLQDKLSESDFLILNKMMRDDPGISKTLDESIGTLGILHHVRNQELKKKLVEFDRNEQITSERFRYGQLINFAILITGLILGWMGIVHHFNNENIAARNLEMIHTKLISTEGQNLQNQEDGRLLSEAFEYFKKGDYQNAAQIYDSYAATTIDRQLKSEARWNVLMCHLAMEGAGIRWKQNAKELLVTLPTNLHSKGTKILNLVDSKFYRIFIQDSADQISILKPKLI